jgi:hypothetical protein
LDAFDISFNLVHRDLIGFFNRVPNTQVCAVLRNDDIRVWHPADKLAVVEKTLFLLLLKVVHIKLLAFVAEEQLTATWVQL